MRLEKVLRPSSITQCLEQMAFRDVLSIVEIGNGPGNFLDLFNTSKRELVADDSLIQDTFCPAVENAISIDITVFELAVQDTLATGDLTFMGIEDLFVQGFGAERCAVVRVDVLHLYIKIYAV